MEKQRLKEGITVVSEISSVCNKYTQEQEIWGKQVTDTIRYNKLGVLINMIRLISLLYDNKT